MAKTPSENLELNGHEVTVTNPDKVFFPKVGITKLALVHYYLSVAPGGIRGCFDRPTSLKRFPNGGIPFAHVREVAVTTRSVLEEHGLQGFPKTSGSRGSTHKYT